MKIKIYFLIIILLLTALPKTFAQLEKHQAIHIIRFAHVIQWPGLERQLTFRIGVFGEDHRILPELKEAAKGIQIGGKDIEVIEFSSMDKLTACHILFIPNTRTSQLRRIDQALLGIPVLFVTETQEYMHSRAIINLYVKDQKLVYQLNKEKAEEVGLILTQFVVNNAEE